MEIKEYDSQIPHDVTDGAPLVVLLHGRGSHEGDLVELGPSLLDGAVVVTPRAPFPAEPWGYGPGWAWYRIDPGFQIAADTLIPSLIALDDFLQRIATELPVETGPLVLGGFSQGGTVSQAYSVRNPGKAPLVVNFSGFLADDPAISVTEVTVAGTRFFWGHGVHDPAVPFELALRGRERLRSVGAELEARDYRIGHWIDAEELRDARRWVEQALDTPG